MSYAIIKNGQKNIVAGRVAPIVDRYSTDEVKTDKEWIDGRPIYRIVVPNPTSFSISANTWAASNITVPNNIYLVGGACIEHIVTSNASTLANWLSMIAQNGKLQFLHTRNASMTISTNFLFILEYVKN